MLAIQTKTCDSVISFAADELQRYLAKICPSLNADEKIVTFTLGLCSDFHIETPSVRDAELDDCLYIEASAQGGIIAGSNPRSALLAVYEYLRQIGCRFLFPGKSGEIIPTLNTLPPVTYLKTAANRFRGPCIEGAISREILMETIAFLPKVGMNTFMMQFFEPYTFFVRYYEHASNTKVPKGHVSVEQVREWKNEAVAEMKKRGLLFHDVGHGWCAAPFGIDTSTGWNQIDDSKVPAEARRHLALFNGVRKLGSDSALITQFCMSSPEARSIVTEYIASYADEHRNTDYLHVWLGDGWNNHCTCEECEKKSVSDWYVMLLNEIDEALRARGLSTRIVFIAYLDTAWAPAVERLKNPERFVLMIAPITRDYTCTLTDKKPTLHPYVRNNSVLPPDLDTYMGYFDGWKEIFSGQSFSFEYHFWSHQVYDPSGLWLSRRIYEDAKGYTSRGLDGMLACGTQRAYFPTGLSYYIFARAQFDGDAPYEALCKEYFDAAFGAQKDVAVRYLSRVAEAIGDRYLEGKESADPTVSNYYNPTRAQKIESLKDAARDLRAELRADAAQNDTESESVRLLLIHARYVELLVDALVPKAMGDKAAALDALSRLQDEMSEIEESVELLFELDLTYRKLREALNRSGEREELTLV